MPNTRADSSHWRTALLEAALYVLAATALALCWFVHTYPVRAPWLITTLSCVAALAVAASLLRNFGYYARTLIVLGGVHVVCAAPLLRGALATPNTSSGFLLEAVLATLLLHRRAGFAVIAAVAATFGLAYWLNGHLPPVRPAGWEQGFDTTHADVAARVAFVACMVSFAVVLGISYLLQRLERALDERDRTLQRLAEEHAARVAVMRELEQCEAAFLRARELEVLGRLAGFVVHDFNNALLAIFGGTELARHASSEREREDGLSIIQSAAMQAASTAKQLRAFGPRSRSQTKLLDAGQVARAAERLLRTLLPQSIELNVYTEPTPRIRADEGLLQSALMNLSLNAWDAMRGGGRLDIYVRAIDAPEGGRRVVIEVHDSGVGMDEATAERVFAPFFTTKGAAGSGLGLASVRQIVEAEGGDVSVRSALGRGTCVQLRWPVADTDEHVIVPNASTVPPALQPGNVLVIDDDTAVRTAVATYLRRRGLTAFEAATRDEALQLATRRNIDVVITDGLATNSKSATSFVRELRESAPNARILLCSGCDPEDFEVARRLVEATLTKPFELEALLGKLEPLMERPAPSSELSVQVA